MPNDAGHAYDDGTRRTEILQTAALLIATSGLRTSLQEIADAAGILPGSLYHHFESKEAILVELLRRYHQDLDRIAERAQARLDEPDSRSAVDRIVDLSSAIAQCAVTHRAALQMTFYEGPSSSAELTALAQQRPTAILEAMLQTLRAARWGGYLRSDVDLPVLADHDDECLARCDCDELDVLERRILFRRHDKSGAVGQSRQQTRCLGQNVLDRAAAAAHARFNGDAFVGRELADFEKTIDE